ncbi:MAG: hypothetical protein KQJ78_12195 [Deltaproteobacteria bacterium]|nr:hypothetical protein [Deltaproteobacteria bacterium]
MSSPGSEVLSWLTEQGVQVAGAAPVAALAGAPAGRSPTDWLPGARSVVIFGLPVPRGVFRAAAQKEAFYGRAASLLYRRLDTLALEAAALLEEAGGAALPIPGCFPYDFQPGGRFQGFLSLTSLAQAAGLGVRGRSGLLLHPVYGPRLILGGVVAEAEVPPLAPAPAAAGCPPECRKCQEVCPVGALTGEGPVDGPACTRASTLSPLYRFLKRAGAAKQGEEGILNLTTAVDDHSWYTCLECVAACPLT